MVKARCARVLGFAQTDTRLLEYVSDATERLLYSGKWKDSVIRYQVCVNDACLTWPRDVETIEQAALCQTPLMIRNRWFEFISYGIGIIDETNTCDLGLVDRGSAVAFDDVTGTGKKLAVYCDGTETGQILLRYYDKNGLKVYTTVSGAREEGEFLTFAAAGNYVYSTYEVLPYGLYLVIKPATNRVVRLYEYDTVAATYKPLAYYEPDELIPEYRRSVIPSIRSGSCSEDATCSRCVVTIMGKIRHVPPTGDNSILSIPNETAIRLACQALKKEEDNQIAEAEAYWQKAYNVLNAQLHHVQGDGVVQPIRVETFGGPVLNMQ